MALLGLLRRRAGRLGLKEVARSGLRVLAASTAMGAVAWFGARFGQWELGGNNPRNLTVFALTATACVATYLAAAALLGSPELRDLQEAVRRRVRA